MAFSFRICAVISEKKIYADDIDIENRASSFFAHHRSVVRGNRSFIRSLYIEGWIHVDFEKRMRLRFPLRIAKSGSIHFLFIGFMLNLR